MVRRPVGLCDGVRMYVRMTVADQGCDVPDLDLLLVSRFDDRMAGASRADNRAGLFIDQDFCTINGQPWIRIRVAGRNRCSPKRLARDKVSVMMLRRKTRPGDQPSRRSAFIFRVSVFLPQPRIFAASCR